MLKGHYICFRVSLVVVMGVWTILVLKLFFWALRLENSVEVAIHQYSKHMVSKTLRYYEVLEPGLRDADGGKDFRFYTSLPS